jgi:hypothetical protein
MIDPQVALVEMLRTNFSSANPTLTQMSGRIFTGQTERPFMAPSVVVGPYPSGPSNWLAQFEIVYHNIIPITAYSAYDVNPLNTGTTEQTAKIMGWNMIDSVRSLIKNNKNLSASNTFQVVYNWGTPHKMNLTKWRPGVMAVIQNVKMEFVDDVSNNGVIP